MSQPREGKPLSIIQKNEDQKYSINEGDLSSVLLSDNVKDRDVVLISVAGAYRKGKSFLLDFFLRYLYAQYVDHDSSNWMGDENAPLTGFSWRGGTEKETNGIIIWSQPFLYDSPNGDKIAIILMDTQGLFDNQSTTKDCVTIFSISTLLSSLQIYNLSGNIQENDLQYLQLFTEFGKCATNQEHAFQKLLFLIRDWSSPYEYSWGFEGGSSLLERKLAVNSEQALELQNIRNSIKATFNDIGCFLLPHPGNEAAENKNFSGKLVELRAEFIANVNELVPKLLSPDNLLKKEMGGKVLKGSDVFEYFKTYMELFSSSDLPDAPSIYMSTVKTQHLQAKIESQAYYSEKLNCERAGKQFNAIEELDCIHATIRTETFMKYNEFPKLNNQDVYNQYKEELDTSIENIYRPIREQVLHGIINRQPPPAPYRPDTPPIEVQIRDAIQDHVFHPIETEVFRPIGNFFKSLF